MTIALSLIAQILHIALMIAVAPTLAGLIDWLDARLTGRTGPPLLLPWRDLVRLSRKNPITTESASAVSYYAPALGLGATLSAAALVPSFALGLALAPLADGLVIVSLLAVARAAGALAALDSGSALPGLRQQSTSALAVIAEPAMMLAVVTLAMMGGSLNLDSIINQQHEGVLLPAAASSVALAAMLALFVADISATSRDQEVFDGIGLAMVRTTSWLRHLVWIDLIGDLFIPVGIATTQGPRAWLIGLAAWVIKLGVFAIGQSGIQSLLGRVPRHSLPSVVGVAALLALLALIMVLAGAAMA